MPRKPVILLALLFSSFAVAQPQALPVSIVRTGVRIQIVTPDLVRIEARGPEGFENRNTFMVVHRPERFRVDSGNRKVFKLEGYTLTVGEKPTDVKIADASGHIVYQFDGKPVKHTYLPAPGEPFSAYVIADNPRIVPPAWGATPPPADNQQFKDTSGWDTANDAADVYVFLHGKGGYKQLRKDFLDLTGHTPMPPLKAFGLWDSRYYEYTEQSALDTIDEYRRRGYPLDMFVVDTDWRVNGSHGYDINTKDFPDMGRFIREAHERHVNLMFNDHPEPQAATALAPSELEYRWNGLTSLLKLGADVWWYDRNWSTVLHEPAPGISKEVWGAAMVHDITQRFSPDKRPMLMSNVEGIDNGFRHYAPSPAFHRYPIWWTGDTLAHFEFLRYGIQNGVDSGVLGLLPYVNEDLGGHVTHPTPELYIRYLEYGCLSPITRIHCTKGEDRHPWVYGPEAERIVREYVKLRYRLLPVIYDAARRAYDDGTPLLRRLDLEWPTYKEAASNTQFMLGNDILVAPVDESVVPPAQKISGDLLRTTDGKPGLDAEYFDNKELSGAPKVKRVDKDIDFDWKGESPVAGVPAENWSARWNGILGPVPETGDYRLQIRMDDGCRLWLDGKLLLDNWNPNAEIPVLSDRVHLEKGQSYPIRIEYLQLGGESTCHFEWIPPGGAKKVATRTLWVPPGRWEDAWSGGIEVGPKTITVNAPIWKTPIYVRQGGIVMLAPEMDYVGQRPWDTVTLEAYPPAEGKVSTRRLYEDDGASNEYLTGGQRTTEVRMSRSSGRLDLRIRGAKGAFRNAQASRAWLVRIHLRPNEQVSGLELDGSPIKGSILRAGGNVVPIPIAGTGRPGPSAGSVVEIRVPSGDVSKSHRITATIGAGR